MENLVDVFREVRRVLRPDGTLWLNLGDSYARAGGWSNNNGLDGVSREECDRAMSNIPDEGKSQKLAPGLKEKDLSMIPARVAIALQQDGWWLRSDIIWAKGISLDERMGSCMPESVTDRPTSAHEHIFLLSPSKQYFYDHEAIKEELKHPGASGMGFGGNKKNGGATYSGNEYDAASTHGGNIRNVWHTSPKPYPDAHFAVYPPNLIRPCILAGTSERGCCPECGAAYKRVTDRKPTEWDGSEYGERRVEETGGVLSGGTENSTLGSNQGHGVADYETVGWEPTCDHDEDPVPCTVLDPFAGSGTTLAVAKQLGRDGIGIDLNPDYCEMARERILEANVGLPQKTLTEYQATLEVDDS